MAIAMGQFTIHDYNDAVTLSGYISSNLNKYQIYNPDNETYNPDYTQTNLVLTPELYVIGTSGNIITSTAVQSVTWYKDNSSTPITASSTYVFSGTKNHILTIKSNILSGTDGAKFTCQVVYRDPASSLDLTYRMDIAFTRVSSGGGIVTALASTPNGNVFKNGENGSGGTSLSAECYLWRGGECDTTNITYQWYKQDASVVTDEGGGVGWKRLSNTTNMYTGVTTATLTVYADAVTGIASFKCIITDTDSTSATYNQGFTDFVTFADYSDPIQMEVQSSAGDVFKNGVGSTTLSARLFRGGEEIDTNGTEYTYKWYRYNKNGVLDTSFGGTGISYKTGKTLAVDGDDVDVKATFLCEIE